MSNPNTAPGHEARQFRVVEGITDGVPMRLTMTGSGIKYEQEGATAPHIVLGGAGPELAQALIRNADTPYLASQLLEEGLVGSEPSVKERYLQLTQRTLNEHPLRSHFVRTGRGSATWYGFLTDNQDPSIFINIGRDILAAGPKARIDRRLRPFVALEKLYEKQNAKNEEDLEKDGFRFSKKVLAGAGALSIVAVGGVVTYVLQKRKTS